MSDFFYAVGVLVFGKSEEGEILDKADEFAAGIFTITIALFVPTLILWFFMGGSLEISFFEPFTRTFDLSAGFEIMRPIMAIGVVLSLVTAAVRVLLQTRRKNDPVDIFFVGGFLSFFAGLFEELIFRWLLLAALAMSFALFDKIDIWFFDGLTQWIASLFTSVFDAMSFGLLNADIEASAYSWHTVSAIALMSLLFSLAHCTGGLYQMTITFFAGVLLMKVALNYSIVIAMILHFAYNMTLYTIYAVSSAMRPDAWSYRKSYSY